MRIIFIHGLGETEDIFKQIAPDLGGEQVFLNLWTLLENEKPDGLNVMNFSKTLVQKYNISQEDWIIGHSLGGWIAYYMKHHCNCNIILIASFTSFDKVITPIRSGKLAYWMAAKGLFFNNFLRWVYIQKYKRLPSLQVNTENFTRLMNANSNAVTSQLKLLYEPVPTISVTPNLRIHALKDAIVRCPAESFHEVPGDHYSLVTYPETVIKPIIALLKAQ